MDVARLINEEDMEPNQEAAVNRYPKIGPCLVSWFAHPKITSLRSDIAMGVTPIAARESVVKYQMAQKEDQFTTLTNFTIFCGTWNVNGQSPDSQVRKESVKKTELQVLFTPIFKFSRSNHG